MLMVAIPTLRELSRAARSAEKLFDTLDRELPPTLEALRLTGLELTELTDDVSDSVQHAGRVVQQVDEGLSSARQQAKSVQTSTRSLLAGAKAAWQAWSQPMQPPRSRKRPRKLSSKPPRSLQTKTLPRVPPTRPAGTAPAQPSDSKTAASLPPSAAPARSDADISPYPIPEQAPLPDPWVNPDAPPSDHHPTAPDAFAPYPPTVGPPMVETESTKPPDSPGFH